MTTTDDLPVPVPDTYKFDESGFAPHDFLETIGGSVIDKHRSTHFKDIHKYMPEIVFIWKQKGGTNGGAEVLGRCVKPSGLLKYFGRADYVVWVAADHFRNRGFNQGHLKALVFHELSHIAIEFEDNSEKPVFKLRGHDFEGFGAEIEEYGLWKQDAEEMARAMQPRLFDLPPARESEATR